MYNEELPWSDQFPVASGSFSASDIDFGVVEPTEDREAPSQADQVKADGLLKKNARFPFPGPAPGRRNPLPDKGLRQSFAANIMPSILANSRFSLMYRLAICR